MEVNIVSLTGYLVRDPIILSAEDGMLIGWFTLENDYCYEGWDGHQCVETAVVTCKVVGPFAEQVARRRKGDVAHVRGRLRTDTLRKRGKWQAELVLVVDFLEARQSSATLGNNASTL